MTKSPCSIPGSAAEPDFSRRIVASRVRPGEAGLDLAGYLARRFTYRDRAGWLERLAAGEFTLNGAPAAGAEFLAPGDRVEWFPGDLEEPEVATDFAIVHADEFLLVVAKPGDLPVHPAGAFFRHTLWHMLRRDHGDVHPVNRLDRETSGLVLFARDAVTAGRLAAQLPEMEKRYLAIVRGEFHRPVDADGWLAPDPASPVRKKQRWLPEPVPGAIPARTEFIPLTVAGGHSLVEARPKTGRMHQIRATLASLGYPLVGDKLYGPDERLFLKIRDDALTEADYRLLGMRRQALHAWRLRLRHPVTGDELHCEAPVPEDFQLPEFPA